MQAEIGDRSTKTTLEGKGLYGALVRFLESYRHLPLALLLLAVLVIFPTLGKTDLKSWDEATYASVSRTLYRTGDIVNLKLGDQPYMNKPPLFFALTAAAYRLFGINEFSARFVSGVFGVAGLLAGYALLGRLFGRAQAFICSLLLLSATQYVGEVIQHGRMESMVNFFIILSLYALLRLRENAWWSALFFGSVALGVLTKASMGLMPLFIAVPYLFFDRNIRKNLKPMQLLLGIVICAAIAGPWFYSQCAAYGDDYLGRFVGYETFKRIQKPIEGHTGSPLFYLQYIGFEEVSSWAFLLPLAVPFLLYHASKDRNRDKVFISIFLLVTFLIFSLGVKTKIKWYSFVMYLPMAYACVYLLSHVGGRARVLRDIVLVATVLMVLSFNVLNFKDRHSLGALVPAFRSTLQSEDMLTAYGITFQKAYFYADCKVRLTNTPEDFRKAFKDGEYFLLTSRVFDKLTDGLDVEIIERTPKHVFFRRLGGA